MEPVDPSPNVPEQEQGRTERSHKTRISTYVALGFVVLGFFGYTKGHQLQTERSAMPPQEIDHTLRLSHGQFNVDKTNAQLVEDAEHTMDVGRGMMLGGGVVILAEAFLSRRPEEQPEATPPVSEA